jgi:hypothetical protein
LRSHLKPKKEIVPDLYEQVKLRVTLQQLQLQFPDLLLLTKEKRKDGILWLTTTTYIFSLCLFFLNLAVRRELRISNKASS